MGTRSLSRIAAAVASSVLLAAACSGGGAEEATDDGSSTTVASTSTSTSTSTPASIEASTTETIAASTSSTSSSTTTGPSTTPTTAATTSTATGPTLIDGGNSFAFTSPTGNIACNLVAGPDGWVSCWIGEKSWEIEQPDGPDCDISDWGNAVDLGPSGPSYPCYTDLAWDVFADPLDYGLTVAVGEYRCESARTGVTCTNAAGQGFSLARAAVELF